MACAGCISRFRRLLDFVRQAAEKALSGLVGMATPLISLRRSAPSSTQVNLIPFFTFSYSCVCDMRDSSLACYYVVSFLRS
jgi:hypothetical protein